VLETSDSWEARSNAAEALGQIGPAAKSAVELLKHASTEDESGDVRMNASEALQLLR
jgi:HEAT repeat protein